MIASHTEPKELILSECKLDASQPIPLYHQLYSGLVRLISSGLLPPEAKLLSEHELSMLLGVSLTTINRAMKKLIVDGIVFRQHGRGTFVSSKFVGREPGIESPKYTEDFMVLNRKAENAFYQHRQEIPDGEISKAFDMDSGQKVHEFTQYQLLEGEPFCCLSVRVKPGLAKHLLEKRIDELAFGAIAECLGYHLEGFVQLVSAVRATVQQSSFLGIEPDSLVLLLERVFNDEHGAKSVYLRAHINPELYSVKSKGTG